MNELELHSNVSRYFIVTRDLAHDRALFLKEDGTWGSFSAASTFTFGELREYAEQPSMEETYAIPAIHVRLS